MLRLNWGWSMKQKLVLVPGVAGDERLWQFQSRHLADMADIVVPNLKGCGSRKEMANEVLSCVDGVFALAGVSMGGWVGFTVATEAPERVNKFAAICTWARPKPKVQEEQEGILEYIKAGHFKEFMESYVDYAIGHAKRNDPVFVDFINESTQDVDEAEMIRHLSAYLAEFDSQDLLPRIKCPTLVIAGSDDAIFGVEEHEYIASNIKGARLAIIDDCGHHVPFEQPAALSTLLRYWLMYF